MITIHTPRGRLASAEEQFRAKEEAITAFRSHLHSSKFQREGPDGDRNDWIAVSDVLRWLTLIAEAGG